MSSAQSCTNERRRNGDGRPGSGEHGIAVDDKDNVWLTGNGDGDGQVLKFTKDGKFLLQIGKGGVNVDSSDTTHLSRPAGITVYAKTNEVFVADGYGNRRVIVFDADTGAYKRHWGAYGNKPDDKAAERARSRPGQDRSSSTRRTASRSPTMASCMWPIAPTTASSRSGWTARS